MIFQRDFGKCWQVSSEFQISAIPQKKTFCMDALGNLIIF